MSKSIISQVNLKDVEFDGKPAIFSIRADSNIKAKLILNENGNLGIFLTVKGFSNELSTLVKYTQNLGWHSDFEIETFLPTDELTTLETLKRKGLAFSILSDSIEDIFQNHIQTLDSFRNKDIERKKCFSQAEFNALVESSGKYMKIDKRTAREIIQDIHERINIPTNPHKEDLKLLTLTVRDGTLCEVFETFCIAKIKDRFSKYTSDMEVISNNDLIEHMVRVGYVYVD